MRTQQARTHLPRHCPRPRPVPGSAVLRRLADWPIAWGAAPPRTDNLRALTRAARFARAHTDSALGNFRVGAISRGVINPGNLVRVSRARAAGGRGIRARPP